MLTKTQCSRAGGEVEDISYSLETTATAPLAETCRVAAEYLILLGGKRKGLAVTVR